MVLFCNLGFLDVFTLARAISRASYDNPSLFVKLSSDRAAIVGSGSSVEYVSLSPNLPTRPLRNAHVRIDVFPDGVPSSQAQE